MSQSGNSGAAQRGSVALSIGDDHPALPGHFPGMPIVPGVVLLDHALACIAQAGGFPQQGLRINSVKFLSPLLPGEPLRLEWAVQASGAIAFELFSAARKIASASLRPAEPGAQS
ncbi:MAG: 3-hydroxyacyl-ACP dehydratase FabZ family protein [Janthinobacterium lividum]